jgi:O-acetyl-ADP-ribose deacetylase (regulator of RNase III)
MKLFFETGFAASKKVDVIINSANGLLFADSSGAGAIREASGDFSSASKKEFEKLFSALPALTRSFFEEKRLKHAWEYKFENLSCLKLFSANQFRSFVVGSSVVDAHWSNNPTESRVVLHAITLTYDPVLKKRHVGSEELIAEALSSAIEEGLHLHKTSFALPVACARPEYGLGPKRAFEIVCRVLSRYEDRAITVIVCFDNAQTSEYFENKLRGKNPLDFL